MLLLLKLLLVSFSLKRSAKLKCHHEVNTSDYFACTPKRACSGNSATIKDSHLSPLGHPRHYGYETITCANDTFEQSHRATNSWHQMFPLLEHAKYFNTNNHAPQSFTASAACLGGGWFEIPTKNAHRTRSKCTKQRIAQDSISSAWPLATA